MKKLKTYQLAIKFYNNAKNLHLKEPLNNQFQRAILSIVLNIAEGSAKPSSKERRRFYTISLGSLRETQAILEIINHKNLIEEANKLGGYLYKLCKNTWTKIGQSGGRGCNFLFKKISGDNKAYKNNLSL